MKIDQLPKALWKHQHEAVSLAHDYLESHLDGSEAALLTMPTGTGKTGVIAAIVSLLPVTGHRLVLSPWDALVRQLQTDLSGRFWSRLPTTQRPELPPVRHLPSSTQFEQISQIAEPTIFVATIAAISVMAKRSSELDYTLADLFSDFACVIVDEGHYEPAFQWSQAIRSLDRPTILLTATPYRNDLKFFRVGEGWRYRMPHHVAEKGRFLRRPSFHEVDAHDPVEFAARIVQFMNVHLAGDSEARAIIRCKDQATIRTIATALEASGETVVGVHERFPPGDSVLRREVPPVEHEARYWVHQNKLIEGIDDPRFKVVALYDSLRNDRAVVQQIGRVLRNPGRKSSNATAFVVGRGDRDLKRTWDGYLRFDRQQDADSVATIPDVVGKLLDAQPGSFYYEGRYREAIDLDDPDAWRGFAFPLSTRIFRASGSPPPLDELTDRVRAEWQELDRLVYRSQRPDDRTVLIPYVATDNSPLLQTGTFIEARFGYTVLRLKGDLLFVWDAQGITPRDVLESFDPLLPSELQGLFPRAASRLTAVSLLNTDIGAQAPRSRRVRALAIDGLSPDLADYAYICSVAEGYTQVLGRRFRRYLGLSRSRVADYRTTEGDFTSYDEWLGGIEGQLASKAGPVATFDRYALVGVTPSDPTPCHVLLEIDPSEFRGFDDATLEIQDLATPVDPSGSLTVIVNGEPHEATLVFDRDKQRYVLESTSLQAEQFRENTGARRELVRFVNDEQALRVIPTPRTSIYSHGSFFEPVLPIKKAGSFQLLDVLHGTTELEGVTSEKGNSIVADDWQPDSLFGLVSALATASASIPPPAMSDIFDNPELLLCTDMGTEVSDFVVTQGTRIAFIHAKASPTPHPYSASALQEVTAQAIKNLSHLQPLTEDKPPTALWTKPWRLPGTDQSTHRLRAGSYVTSTAMWDHMRSIISNPSAEREIWLVLGNGLSVAALKEQARKRPPAAEAIQVFSLLQSAWASIAQLGVRLRIFCSP